MRCWVSKEKKKLACPYCRREMSIIMVNFDESEVITDEHKNMLKLLKEYNAVYSGNPRTVTTYPLKY